MSAGRLLGVVVGIAQTGYGNVQQVSILVNPPAVQIQVPINTPSSSLLAQLSLGQIVPIYVALSPADQTAIEASTTITPFETND